MADQARSRDLIPEPEPIHRRTPDTESDDEFEATELRDVSATERVRVPHALSPTQHKRHWYNPIHKFWRHHIRISVPHNDCRDHLGENMQSLLTIKRLADASIAKPTNALSLATYAPHSHSP